jgi:hypothetical protein
MTSKCTGGLAVGCDTAAEGVPGAGISAGVGWSANRGAYFQEIRRPGSELAACIVDVTSGELEIIMAKAAITWILVFILLWLK